MHILLAAIIFLCAGLYGPAAPAAGKPGDLPTGTIAVGHIEPVPAGNLYVGVVDQVLAPQGFANVGGPPGFIVSDGDMVQVTGITGTLKLGLGAAVFVAGGRSYRVTNSGAVPVRLRFIGLGAHSQVKGARYEMEPLPWGPQTGKAYDVTLDRGPFPANSETAWHGHTGPAFGVLDGGTWENRQATGRTLRIQTPGYYIQPANAVHQLAQSGSGGVALIVQFSPPGKPRTFAGPGRGTGTPVVLAGVTTPFPAPTQPPSSTAVPATLTRTVTPTLTLTVTPLPTGTPTSKPSATASFTRVPPTVTPTYTAVPTGTPGPTKTTVPTDTPEIVPTSTAVLPVASATPTPPSALFSGGGEGLMTLLAVVLAGGLVAGGNWLLHRKPRY